MVVGVREKLSTIFTPHRYASTGSCPAIPPDLSTAPVDERDSVPGSLLLTLKSARRRAVSTGSLLQAENKGVDGAGAADKDKDKDKGDTPTLTLRPKHRRFRPSRQSSGAAPRLTTAALQQIPKLDTTKRVKNYIMTSRQPRANGVPYAFNLEKLDAFSQTLDDVLSDTTSNHGLLDMIHDVMNLEFLMQFAEHEKLDTIQLAELVLPLLRLMRKDQLLSRWDECSAIALAVSLVARHSVVIEALVKFSGITMKPIQPASTISPFQSHTASPRCPDKTHINCKCPNSLMHHLSTDESTEEAKRLMSLPVKPIDVLVRLRTHIGPGCPPMTQQMAKLWVATVMKNSGQYAQAFAKYKAAKMQANYVALAQARDLSSPAEKSRSVSDSALIQQKNDQSSKPATPVLSTSTNPQSPLQPHPPSPPKSLPNQSVHRPRFPQAPSPVPGPPNESPIVRNLDHRLRNERELALVLRRDRHCDC
ncbi:hypothetical protein BZA70DRAFT_267917 [Myxozyma melibiosi]|uniref:Uncharacterized protein n=1 Tax=Myxozyma melibiosi TaxID=54550 RepID=A0ABR1F4G9_9ASCO